MKAITTELRQTAWVSQQVSLTTAKSMIFVPLNCDRIRISADAAFRMQLTDPTIPYGYFMANVDYSFFINPSLAPYLYATVDSSTATLTINWHKADYGSDCKTLPALTGFYYLGPPGYGTTITDYSGTGNTGTLTNGVLWEKLANGTKVLSFPSKAASTSYVAIGTDSSVLPDAFSIVAWVRTAKTDAQILVGWKAIDSVPVVGPWTNSSLLIYMSATNYRYFSSPGLTDNSWHMIGFTMPGALQTSINTSAAYMDNLTLATSSTVATGAQVSKTTCNLGGTGNTDWPFVGRIALPRLFGSAATAAHMLTIWEREHDLFGV